MLFVVEFSEVLNFSGKRLSGSFAQQMGWQADYQTGRKAYVVNPFPLVFNPSNITSPPHIPTTLKPHKLDYC
jgi:hypothetical protein